MYHFNLEPLINPENMFLSRYILDLYICLTFLVRVGYLGTRPELKMLASQDRVRWWVIGWFDRTRIPHLGISFSWNVPSENVPSTFSNSFRRRKKFLCWFKQRDKWSWNDFKRSSRTDWWSKECFTYFRRDFESWVGVGFEIKGREPKNLKGDPLDNLYLIKSEII